MNEPIVSPWLFYLIDVLNPLPPLLGFIITVCAVTYIIFNLCKKDAYFSINSCRRMNSLGFIPELEEDIKKFDTKIKVAKVVGIVSLLLALFIPSKEAVYKMFVAYHVTPANIQMTGDIVDKSIDKVIEKIINYQKKLEEKK